MEPDKGREQEESAIKALRDLIRDVRERQRSGKAALVLNLNTGGIVGKYVELSYNVK